MKMLQRSLLNFMLILVLPKQYKFLMTRAQLMDLTEPGAIDIEATNGGIGLRWNDSKDFWVEGGRTIITANENTADTIKLHADAGSSQTIYILNDEGTSESAIQLNSVVVVLILTQQQVRMLIYLVGKLLLLLKQMKQ